MYLMDNNKNNFCAIDEDDSMKDELRAKSVYIDRSQNVYVFKENFNNVYHTCVL